MNSSTGAAGALQGKNRDMMLVKFHHRFTNRALEWLFAVFLVGWAAMLFASPSMFDGPVSPQFVALKATFSQTVWAFGCAFMGLTRLVALWINGRSAGTPYIRMTMAFLSCFFWYQISLGLFVSGVPTTAWAIYPVILAFEMYNVFRAASDARLVYDEARAMHDGTNGDK